MRDSKSRLTRPVRSWWRALLADEAGTATTETVIMIPMYAIVWGCIVYVTNHFQNTIELRMRMRRDTWAYAYTACTDMPSTPTNLSTADGLLTDGSTDGGESSTGAAIMVGVAGIMDYIPGLHFDTVEAERSDFSTERPAVIGGGELPVAADLTLLCNERPQGVFDMIVDVIKDFFQF